MLAYLCIMFAYICKTKPIHRRSVPDLHDELQVNGSCTWWVSRMCIKQNQNPNLTQPSPPRSASAICICKTASAKLRLTKRYQLVDLLGVRTLCLAFMNSMCAFVKWTPLTQLRNVSCHCSDNSSSDVPTRPSARSFLQKYWSKQHCGATKNSSATERRSAMVSLEPR